MEISWASEYSEALPETVIVYLQVPHLMDICSVCCKTQINHTSKFLRVVALYIHKKPYFPSYTLSSLVYVRANQRERDGTLDVNLCFECDCCVL